MIIVKVYCQGFKQFKCLDLGLCLKNKNKPWFWWRYLYQACRPL